MNHERTERHRESADTGARLLMDAFERVHELVPAIVQDLTAEELLWRPDAEANSIAWLIWHLTRVQDDHLATLNGSPQLWTAESWAKEFALPYEDSSIGFGQSAQEVAAFTVTDPDLLRTYHAAVHVRTLEILAKLSDEDYDTIIDDSYDPPVTLGTRLVSVINDVTQHIGQAAYVKGLVERRRA